MPSLVILGPPARGAQFSISSKRDAVIGRDGVCDVVLLKRTVSRRHARIFFDGTSYLIEDLGSSHGTFVNGHRVDSPMKLADGDHINVYDVPAVFSTSDSKKMVASSKAASTTEFHMSKTMGVDFRLTPPPPTVGTSYFHGRLRSLVEITRRLGSSLAIDEILPRILDLVFEMFPQASSGEIQVADRSGNLSPVALKHGRDDDSSIVTRLPVGNDIAKQVLVSGQPLLRMAGPATESVLDEPTSSLVCVPILGPSLGKLGTILLEAEDANRTFTADDMEIVAAVGIEAGQAVEYARSHRAALELEHTRRQMETARQIQLRMLPKRRPVVPDYEFSEFYSAAESVGGDFYFWDALPDGRVVMGVADACGKGLPAALLIAQFVSEVRHCLASATSIKAAMVTLNRFVLGQNEGFITFCLALLDHQSHSLTIVNAGHLPPLWRRFGGRIERLDVGRGGLPFGVEGEVEYHPIKVTLAVGDEVLLFTDGITEAMSPKNELYGFQRLENCLASEQTSLDARVSAIVSDIDRFRAGRIPWDDSCLIAFRRNPNSESG